MLVLVLAAFLEWPLESLLVQESEVGILSWLIPLGGGGNGGMLAVRGAGGVNMSGLWMGPQSVLAASQGKAETGLLCLGVLEISWQALPGVTAETMAETILLCCPFGRSQSGGSGCGCCQGSQIR